MKGKLPALEDKHYPREMQVWCAGKVERIEPALDTAMQAYSEEVTKTATPSDALDLITVTLATVDKAHVALTMAYSEWSKGPVAEVKKLLG